MTIAMKVKIKEWLVGNTATGLYAYTLTKIGDAIWTPKKSWNYECGYLVYSWRGIIFYFCISVQKIVSYKQCAKVDISGK